MIKSKNRVGLGTFPLADVFSQISRNDAEKLVRDFVDNGGYYIDTAPMYGFGEVELILGRALKSYNREQYYIATKCGYIDVEGKSFQTIQKSGKYDDVLRECDRSLKRLGVDYIDLYFMHSPDPKTPIGETLQALTDLQKSGKIREIGVSNVNLSELMEYNATNKIGFVQNRFSLLNRSINPDLEQYMINNSIKLVPYQVIDRGQLTNRVSEGTTSMRSVDLRIGRSDWLPEKLEIIGVWADKTLIPIAKRLNISLNQLSISWALQQQFMGFVIVGATKTENLISNLGADAVKLDSNAIQEIEMAYQSLEKIVKEKYGQTIREFRGLNEKYY